MLTSIRTALSGRYVLEREIGRGATAAVYAARDLKHGRRVALKVIERNVVSAPGTHRFLREIRTTAGLNHPHILPLFDSDDVDGFIYYTMPLVEGESLRQRMERHGRMPLDAVLPLVEQMASALSYAHSVGVVHRDIKPENILVGEQGHVWIADFGLARALASAVNERLTGTAMAVGSPHYMSPEQAAGESVVDGRSDIYSLGCVAFELLCGDPPFTGGSVTALLARHLSEPAPSICERCPDVPPAADAALQRAMAKDRSRRFADAHEFVAAIRGDARHDRAASAAQAGSKRWTRHRRASWTGERSVVGTAPPSRPRPHPAARPTLLQRLRRLLGGFFAWLRNPATDGNGKSAGTPVVSGAVPVDTIPPLDPAPIHTAALPTAATPFIGREDELSELHDLLCNSPARIVTVTGTGGVGKTRLALHIAERLSSAFRDGVTYSALSGLASADLLVPSLAESLGIQLSRREDPVGQLKAFLQEKEMLLVLDNFEHLTSAAGLLSTLLDDAPGVRMLVTSRERLNLRHETLVALDGLRLTGGTDESDAVRLFVAGARRIDRHFQLGADNRAQVVRICELLGGIPLAIELASSWVRVLSCAEILTELERDLDMLSNQAPDLEERHRSLRATFDASWRLLSAEEQSALARLAVFRSAFDRATSGQVADASVPLLRQLVDKSLLTRSGERLLMLDVVRTFALDRLAAEPDIERRAHERHLSCFSSLLGDLQYGMQRADAVAIRRIADSIDDIRAAWDYATQTNNVPALLRAMDSLFHFYEVRGWAREGAEVFARTSAAVRDAGHSGDVSRTTRLAAARLDVCHGVFLHRLGDLEPSEALLRRGVASARELEENALIVFALHRLGVVRHGMGDYAEAERLHQEARMLAQQLNDRIAVGWSMTYLGNVAWSRGEFDGATRLYTDALEVLREEHDVNGMCVVLNNLGVLAASRQQYEEARRRFREGLAFQSELNNPRLAAQGLHNLGCSAYELGDFANARHYLHESLEISNRMGYQSLFGLTLVALARLSIGEGDEAEGLTTLQRALRIAGAARTYPLALEALLVLARLRLRQGDRPGAAELAAVIAGHPGSDSDVRNQTATLLQEIGGDPPPAAAAVDLGALIDRITGTSPTVPAAGKAAVAAPHQKTNAQPAGDS